MTKVDYELEKHYKAIAERPPRKFEETITSFDRNIFLYDRDEVARQAEKANRTGTKKVTYEDHRKAAETAVNIFKASSAHEVAMTILTHRHFAEYRKNCFAGVGSFNSDYSYILGKVGELFSPSKGQINTVNIGNKLAEFKKPTLVQINHIKGFVTEVKVPSDKFTLQEWAAKYNHGAPESTTYAVAGLKVGI